jgi:hypothetical protein
LLFSRASSQDSEIDDDNTNVKSTSWFVTQIYLHI